MMTLLGNVAVFIDFENVAHEDDADPKVLVAALRERGRLVVKRAYADWGRFATAKRQFLEASIDLVEVASHTGRGKNAADIRLVVDALDVAMTHQHVKSFAIVSGDSDIIPLVSKLRELDKYVVVVAPKRSAAKLLKGYCDELHYLSSLAGEDAEPEDLKLAFAHLARVLDTLDEGNGVNPSRIADGIRNLDPAFSHGRYGFRQFKDFLFAAQKGGHLRLESKGGDLLCRAVQSGRNSADPSPTTPDTRSNASRLLARLRKDKMRHVGLECQSRILGAVFQTMRDSGSMPFAELTDRLEEGAFEAEIAAGTLSRTKIAGVIRIALRACALEVTNVAGEAPLTVRLSSTVSSIEDMLAAHNRYLKAIAREEGISLSETEWRTLLCNPPFPVISAIEPVA